MNRIEKLSFIASLIALSSSAALAGAKYTIPVHVDTTNRVAFGSLGSARSSTDENQQLGCYTLAFPGTAGAGVGVCFAQNAVGVWGSCVIGDHGMLDTARSIASDAYVYFAWDATGACTLLEVETWSAIEPKN
jgi:hypothetical protein